MKHVCLAQTPILFKGLTCNHYNLCPRMSQHITGGDMLKTADETSVAPLSSLLVKVLRGNDFEGE